MNDVKSYLTDEERDQLRNESDNMRFLAESQAADDAGDAQASWAWLAMADLPAYSLAYLKKRHGSQFIHDMGFQTKNADAAYGPGWLNR